jgi:hypothetical protein
MPVNVWRPITGPVRRTLLALADASSVKSEELVAADQLFPGRVGEIYQLAFGAGQPWYWASEIDRDEVILIKGWDSLDDGGLGLRPMVPSNFPTTRTKPHRARASRCAPT